MVEKVDSGPIIEERRFPVLRGDTVETLKFRTMIVMLNLFHDMLMMIASGEPLPDANISWSRRPFTRAQLNKLCSVTPDLPEEEIARRVRATTYPGYPGATVLLGGFEFTANVPNRKAIA
jgi:methionyl-tRNA formyltransferase